MGVRASRSEEFGDRSMGLDTTGLSIFGVVSERNKCDAAMEISGARAKAMFRVLSLYLQA